MNAMRNIFNSRSEKDGIFLVSLKKSLVFRLRTSNVTKKLLRIVP